MQYAPDLHATPREKLFYTLVMFPYPSGYGLHVGHASNFVINDVLARYKRLQGYTVFNPFGYDSFGLPTENYAMKLGKPAYEVTAENITYFKSQIAALHLSFDTEREVVTSSPDYYKRTQWLFEQLYKAGLVFRDTLRVNRCPECQTVLANDQVVEGACERCRSEIIQKKHPQWFIKITDYADKLLQDLDLIDRPEETKIAQRNWIGRSEGVEIDFALTPSLSQKERVSASYTITVFTTRPDTLYGVTALVLAPENTVLDDGLVGEYKTQVEEYRQTTLSKTAVQRQKELKEKTGVFSGLYATHPLTGENVPILYADYVLPDYGTGAVMMVPAHDERDWEFAQKFGIEVRQVISPHPHPLPTASLGEGGGLLSNNCTESVLEDSSGVEQNACKCVNEGCGESACVEDISTKTYKNTMYPSSSSSATIIEYAKELRKQGTNGENFVWELLRNRKFNNLKWRRQFPLLKYIADFYCDELKLVIEIDGPHHAFQKAYDQQRDEAIGSLGITVERISADTLYHQPGTLFEIITQYTKKQSETFPFPSDDEGGTIGRGRGGGAYTGPGVLINSAEFDGLDSVEAKKAITDHLESLGKGNRKTTYKLRDRSVSRQRYRGCPIPVYYDEHQQPHLVPEEELPVVLPLDLANYKPTGKSPLEDHPTFPIYEKNGKNNHRECDTLDTFMCSSFYFLRYPDANNPDQFCDPQLLNKCFPIDFYIGGKEHTVGHLLYARFIHKFLYDQGWVSSPEPFQRLVHQGIVLGTDGRKMSKRRGNIIDPIQVIETYGVDAVRTYLMFMGPVDQEKAWNDGALTGVGKFLARVKKISKDYMLKIGEDKKISIERALHKAIKGVTHDMEALKFNTAVSKLMIFLNVVEEHKTITNKQLSTFMLLLFPFAPVTSREIWESLGNKQDIESAPRPVFDPSLVQDEVITLPVQINGKMRANIIVSPDADEAMVLSFAQQDAGLIKYLDGQTIRKVVYVKGRILNIVI